MHRNPTNPQCILERFKFKFNVVVRFNAVQLKSISFISSLLRFFCKRKNMYNSLKKKERVLLSYSYENKLSSIQLAINWAERGT